MSDPTAPLDPPAEAAAPDAGTTDHDSTGLQLARAVARAVAGVRPGARGTGRRTTLRPGGAASGRDSRRSRGPQVSGAHPDDRDPQTLEATIGRLVGERGWGTDMRVHGVLAHWDRIVGPEVAQHVSAVAFTQEETDAGLRGRLVVQTDSTAWATQMRLLAPTVVRRLNEELGDGTVAVVDVQGPASPRWGRGRWSVRDGRGPRDTYG